MAGERLTVDEIARLMRDWPGELCDLAIELRDFVLEVAPEAAEKVAFHSLCYYKPNQPYGVIGGNICMVGVRDDYVVLGFIHGAFLPDPQQLLMGKGKSSRHVAIRDPSDIRRAPLRKLIRAAVAYEPTGE